MAGLFDIRREERRTTFAAFGAFLLITTAHTMLETARDALFLSKLPASQLPWMYLGIVVLALGLARLNKTGRKIKADSKAGVAIFLVAGAVLTAVFGRTSRMPTNPSLYMLYLWTGLYASWAMTQLWSFLGSIHTLTQAKRLYGFIGGGAVVGAVVGAVAARQAMLMFAPRYTILISAALFALSALPTLAMTARAPVTTSRTTEQRDGATDETRMSAGVGLLWENAFARRVLGIAVLSSVTLTFVDYLFKAQLAWHIHDTRVLGESLATFYAVTNLLALVAQFVIAPWLFRTQGVQRALLFFPTGVIAASAGVVASIGSLASVYVLKGIDGALRYSLHRTSTELLLVPVPDIIRERIKPIVDLVGTRGGQAFASLAILFLVYFSAGKPRTLGAVVLTLAIIWLVVVVTIRNLYLDVFRETLKTGGLSGKAELPELDAGAYEAIFTGLNSSRDRDVLASLDLLAEQHREKLIPALVLYHPSRDVVMRALDIFSHIGRTDFVSIADRLNDHPDRDVAAAALLARTRVAPDHDLLERRLEDDCAQVRVTALVALMSRGWIDGEAGKKKIEEVITAADWHGATALARAIRDLTNTTSDLDEYFDDVLVRLANWDKSEQPQAVQPAEDGIMPRVHVATEVAIAMGERKKAKFLPALVDMLVDSELRNTARAAIAEIPGALTALDQALSASQVKRPARLQIPRAMTRFSPKDAAPLLLKQLAVQTDGSLKFKILRAIVKLRRQDPDITLDEGILQQASEQAIAHVDELKQWSLALGGEPDMVPGSQTVVDPLHAAHHLLVDLTRDKEVHATQRLFMLLELLFREDFEDVWRGLRSRDPNRRASSLELVENLVMPPLRAKVIALVGDQEPVAPEDILPYDEAITQILQRGGETMRTLASYRAQELGMDMSDISSVSRPSREPNKLAATLGRRFRDRARDLLKAEPPGRPSRAPA